MEERDTHFAGFAKLLEAELTETLDVYFDIPDATEEQIREATRLRIAQRAYDFAAYVIKENIGGMPSTVLLYVNETPDMTEWPERPGEAQS